MGVLSLVVLGAASGLTQSPDSSPVTQVVSVLQSMHETLTHEKEEEDAMFKKMKCWCEDTDKEKRAAVEQAMRTIKSLKASIKQKTGKIGKLEAEIEQLTKTIAEDTETLAAATTLRTEQEEAFHRVETELLASTTALQSAIAVLKKHQTFVPSQTLRSLVQIPSEVQSAVRNAMLLAKKLSSQQRDTLSNLLLSQQPTFEEYASQSGTIFGILGTMLDNFSEDLEQARAQDLEDATVYAKTKEEKEASITANTQHKTDKTILMEKTAAAMEADKQNLATTEDQLGADQVFLANAQADCKQYVAAYDARTEERAKEMKAVSTAITYLNSDAARDLFSRSSFTSFVQQASSSSSKKAASAEKAEQMLKNLGETMRNPQVLALVRDIKHDAFAKVIASIDKMVADLHAQIDTDAREKQSCVDDLARTDSDIATTTEHQGMLNATQLSLTNQIEVLSHDIEMLDEMIKETKLTLAKASAVREEENANFAKVVTDQTASISVLTKAVKALKAVYSEVQTSSPSSSSVSFLQSHQRKPAGAAAYAKHAGGNQVVALIEQIIGDATNAKNLAISAEQEAQAAYEVMVTDSNNSVKEYTRSRTEKKTEKGEKEAELEATNSELEHTTTALGELVEKRANRADECQFLMNNFDARYEHMNTEIEGLTQAKMYLRGMAP